MNFSPCIAHLRVRIPESMRVSIIIARNEDQTKTFSTPDFVRFHKYCFLNVEQ